MKKKFGIALACLAGMAVNAQNVTTSPVANMEEQGIFEEQRIVESEDDAALDKEVTSLTNALSANLSLFPNPASDQFIIKPILRRSLVGIFKLDGTKLHEEWYQPTGQVLNVEFRGLDPGMYIVRVSNPIQQKRFRLQVE